MYYLPYSTYSTYFPGGRGRKRGRVEKDQTITTTKTTKQQTTNNINKQVPFTFFTHNGIRCMVHIPHSFEMYMQCRSKKKIISRSINYYTIPSTYMYLHQHAHLTLPHLTFSFHLIHTTPTTPSHTLSLSSLSLTISGLSPPTLPYPGILGIQCPAFPFPLPALLY